jgi:predicted  nucleic acid-binding Zn-ribbon protein
LSTAFSADLAEAKNRADTLARKLEQSEKARKEAEADAKKAKAEAATVEDLRKRLHEAENSLSERISEQSAREEAIIKRPASQSRRFVSKCPNYFDCFELLLSCLLIDKLLS